MISNGGWQHDVLMVQRKRQSLADMIVASFWDQCSELHVGQTDPTVCGQTVVWKIPFNPTAQTDICLGTDHVHRQTVNYWRSLIISCQTFEELQLFVM